MADSDEAPIEIPSILPLVPLKDLVVFPWIMVPLSISRALSMEAVDAALAGDRVILLSAQKDYTVEEPEPDDIYSVGTIVHITRMLKLPDGRQRILVKGLGRARIDNYIRKGAHFEVRITRLEDAVSRIDTSTLVKTVRTNLDRAIDLGKNISPEVMVIVANLDDPGRLADLMASNLDIKLEDAQPLLEMIDGVKRLRRVSELLELELDMLTTHNEISTAAQSKMDKSQRDMFLRMQLKAIREELGEEDDTEGEIEAYRAHMREQVIPQQAEIEVEKQIRRLRRLPPQSPEVAVLRSYIDWMTTLPWNVVSPDSHDLQRARKILDEEHYGLDDVKERILEYLAVRKLRGARMRGQTLCLTGPPGVGKTSLGRAIARALDRKFVRISLGGVRDEAEIRGQHRTSLGASPGRLLRAIHQAQTSNPVLMLDEVDKIGADSRGDPASALLEVLDPEQNGAFLDHYLGVAYDLSPVMFILTANELDDMRPALLDRMDVIEISGYTDEEKLEIAKRHLIPHQMQENGITNVHVTWTESAIAHVIRISTNEPGLRNLQRVIGAICRRIARHVAEGKRPNSLDRHVISEHNVGTYLGRFKAAP